MSSGRLTSMCACVYVCVGARVHVYICSCGCMCARVYVEARGAHCPGFPESLTGLRLAVLTGVAGL